MNIKIPQHCSKIRYTCHLVNYILLIKDSLAVCPLCVLFKLAGLLCTKLLETGFWLQFIIKNGDRKFILYLETFRGKYDQTIHCKIKVRLNISNKNQENVELLERRAGFVKNIYVIKDAITMRKPNFKT